MVWGVVLGAVRTQELLAARRIDGAELFFTRLIDFGLAKTVDDVFKHWKRDEAVGDIVTVIRSFRPHVVASAPASHVVRVGRRPG